MAYGSCPFDKKVTCAIHHFRRCCLVKDEKLFGVNGENRFSINATTKKRAPKAEDISTVSVHCHSGLIWNNSAIRNCCISVKGAIKLYNFCTSAEQSEAQVPSEVRHVHQRGAILLPFKHFSSNCFISTLFYCLTIEQFLIQVPSEAGMCVEGVHLKLLYS